MEIISTQFIPSGICEITFSEAIGDPLYQTASAILFFLLTSLYLVKKFRQELILAFSDEEGAVRITPNALHELVRKSCENLETVYSPTTKIVHLRGKLRLHVRLRVEADCNIMETRKALRERVEHVLVGNLGLKHFGGVDVVVKGFRENK
jgi:hypothetical protein